MVVFFDEQSKFVGIRCNAEKYKIYRTKDGSSVCTLNDSYFEPVLSEALGGHQVIIGIIDTNSRKYMPWSMEALIHFS
jgi:hypothetical protein